MLRSNAKKTKNYTRGHSKNVSQMSLPYALPPPTPSKITGGQDPGVKGAGGVQEAGEQGMGSRIPSVAGSGRNWENYTTLCNILQWRQEVRD